MNNYSDRADLTMERRNPGVGVPSSWICAKCGAKHYSMDNRKMVRLGAGPLPVCKAGCKKS